MPDQSVPSLFAQIKEWLSFVDSVWGVGGAIVVTALFMYRLMRRDRAINSAHIQQLSSQVGEIASHVRKLETENARLTTELIHLSSRDFERTLTDSKQPTSLSGQRAAAQALHRCFQLNSSYLAEASAVLARSHLEAFYSSEDVDHLQESERFASMSVLVAPAALDTYALKAEVAIAIASNRAKVGTRRPPDELWDEALELLRTSEPAADDKQRFVALQQLGTKLREEGQYELAGAALRASYRASERAFGTTSQETMVAMNNVATNYNDRGFPTEAKPIFEQLAERQQSIAGCIDEQAYQFKLAATACDRQISGEQSVLTTYEALVIDGRERFGSDNRWVLKAQNSLAVCLSVVGRNTEAEQLYRNTIERETRLFGCNHVNPLSTRANLARHLLKVGRKDEAIAQMSEVAQGRLNLHGADHPLTREAQHTLLIMQAAALLGPSDDHS
jgi:tetratricopeptide (TPR) repeat protein